MVLQITGYQLLQKTLISMSKLLSFLHWSIRSRFRTSFRTSEQPQNFKRHVKQVILPLFSDFSMILKFKDFQGISVAESGRNPFSNKQLESTKCVSRLRKPVSLITHRKIDNFEWRLNRAQLPRIVFKEHAQFIHPGSMIRLEVLDSLLSDGFM